MTADQDWPNVGVRHLEVEGFRSARHTMFSPRRLCALVGEARAGKSTLLEAIRAVLDPEAAPLQPEDVSSGATRITIRAELTTGTTLTVEGPPSRAKGTGAPPVVFLPAAERAGRVVAASSVAAPVIDMFKRVLEKTGNDAAADSTTSPALGLVEALEQCCITDVSGTVLLIEEPELYLRPQAQRYLYRLLRQLAFNGNQVIYSTHSPAFLNVARLEELGFVTRGPAGSEVVHAEPTTAQEEFKAMSEFDAERSELFLAQAAILVEGTTEKLALPFVFQALGYDADRNGITIVECGGKAGIPFFARICKTVGVPFLALHDRDAPQGSQPIAAERRLNQLIAELTGPKQAIVLVPDFEAVAGIKGHAHKPLRAWRRFTSLTVDDIPEPLLRTVERSLALAQGGQREGLAMSEPIP
ncbi:MAG TPA: TOPRIM nucleotidyl transferase/hydrolase domain-containing protein [Acidimicrobiia bacterium]|nr:TOPRIM nucleotidyl transferase/hydrolase domain-containing protein [Acidimicrobiia bacterium]